MAKKHKIRGIIGLDESAVPESLELFLDDAGGQDIEVEFNSPGGFVYFGLEMANMIRDYPGHTTAIYSGLAASMSSYIPMAFDKRITYDNAMFMIHNPMGGAFGVDYRGAEKLFTRLKAIREMLGKAYSFVSGKKTPEMHSIMDEETFYYGQEIVDAGFADEIIESSDKDKTKDSAIALAEGEITSCLSTMKASDISVSDDFERAAAYLKVNTPEKTPVKQPPAAAGKLKEEASIMNLKELLAANPEAKTEYDAAIVAAETTARTEGEATGKEKGAKAGREEMQAKIAVVAPFLASADYPAVIGATALKVLKGEESEVTLKASVAAVDAVKESAASTTAATETEETAETVGDATQNAGLSTDGMINNATDLHAAAAQHKAEYGTDGGTK